MKYLVNIEKYESKSKRVTGFSRPAKVGLMVPSPMKIVSGKVFEYWKQEQKLPDTLREEIVEYFQAVKKSNPLRNPYIGRAFYVPGMDSPPGPRTGGVKSADDYLREIVSFYEFAVSSKFDVKGADIALLLHPFIQPYTPPLQVNPEVAYPGGAMTPNIDDESQIIIEVVWGHDEGIQTLPHDTYIVDFEKLLIIEKKIQTKTHALKAGSTQHYDEIIVPPAFQTVQVLNDLQIMQLASDYRRIHDKYGDNRVEFILQPEGIVYRECMRFEVEQTNDPVIVTNKKGKVTLVRTLQDIAKLTLDTEIVAISSDVIKERSMDVLTSVAVNAQRNLIILYPGSATTAHAATIFREQGHTLVYVGTKTFEEGDFIEVVLERNELAAKLIKKNSDEECIIEVNALKLVRQDQAGGKAFRLSELAQFDVVIPKTVVIPTSVFEAYKTAISLEGLTSQLSAITGVELAKVAEQIRKEITKGKIPAAIEEKLMQLHSTFKGNDIAVRSSANCEDGSKASFAGQFDSFSPVNPEKVISYVKKVWASTFNLGAVEYAKKNGIDVTSLEMAVIVQDYAEPVKAGVMFTKNIQSGKSDTVVIEAVQGHGEKVVDGTGEVQEVIVRKTDNEIVEKKGVSILRETEILELVERALYIEKIYGTPQDIEWAIKRNGSLVILQTRPITT